VALTETELIRALLLPRVIGWPGWLVGGRYSFCSSIHFGSRITVDDLLPPWADRRVLLFVQGQKGPGILA